MSALTNYSNTPPTQREKAKPNQVLNNASGYVFEVSDITRLERFLIIGTDKGTYYVSEKDITKQNVDFLRKMIVSDPFTVLNKTVEVSEAGRAYRNEAAIFVLALILAEGTAPGIKQAVIAATPKVARTATHVYQLAEFIDNLGGWGRAKREAIAGWFTSKSAESLAYQAVKYRQRNGWTLRDLMRLSHPQGIDQNVGNFILGKFQDTPDSPAIMQGFTAMQNASGPRNVLSVLNNYPNLPWETIPTEFLKDPKVWKTLFANGQLKGQALVRQITRLSRIGAFNDMVFAREVANALTDSDMIAKTRLHPIQYLLALTTHTEGQLQRNNLYGGYSMWGSARKKDWTTYPVIVDALDAGFHAAFKNLTPANKRTMLALDVSGSMGSDALGIDLSCAQVSAAMAMVTARTEPFYQIMGFATQFRDLGITAKMDLGTVTKKINAATMGGTDVAQPMIWALQNKVEVDTFAIYTDNETWAGRIQPDRALNDYRQKMGINAKLIVVGVSATPFTVGDPDDAGTLNVAGFDSNAPGVISDFSAGRI